MKKTLKATAAIVLCCVLMIVIVIYTPKHTPESTEKRGTLEEDLQRLEELHQRRKKERAPLDLTRAALRKVSEATRAIKKAFPRLTDKEEVYIEKAHLDPLIEANTEASEAVKQRGEALQRLNEEETPLKSFIEANIKANTELIVALAEVSTAMKIRTELLQNFKAENARSPFRPFMNAIDKVSAVIHNHKADNAIMRASHAHDEYQNARLNAVTEQMEGFYQANED